jgi:hypothetical protein
MLIGLLLSTAMILPAPMGPLADLEAAPKPHFRAGHTLPPLTRWGWTMPYDVRIELNRNWGYALEFGGYVTADSVKVQIPT